MTDARVTLAQALRHRRSRELEISQAAFAERVGSSQSLVAKMEAGDPSVTLDLLIRALVKSGPSIANVGRVLSNASLGSAGLRTLKT